MKPYFLVVDYGKVNGSQGELDRRKSIISVCDTRQEADEIAAHQPEDYVIFEQVTLTTELGQ